LRKIDERGVGHKVTYNSVGAEPWLPTAQNPVVAIFKSHQSSSVLSVRSRSDGLISAIFSFYHFICGF